MCLSASAHEYVQRVLPIVFEDLGLQLIKNLERPVRAFMVRRSEQLSSRAIPPIHRHNEFHLGRRFCAVLLQALEEVTKPEGLTPVQPAVLAALDDAPELDERRLAARIGVDVGRVQRIVKHLEGRGLVSRTPNPANRLVLPSVLLQRSRTLEATKSYNPRCF